MSKLNTYDEFMNPTGEEDKKIIHQKGLWHKVSTGIIINKERGLIFFQTIYPKESYGFDRPDMLDFTIGGHIELNETPLQALYREGKEEVGLKNWLTTKELFIRRIDCQPAENYIIKEFQHIFLIDTNNEIEDFDLTGTDSEVKSIVQFKILDMWRWLDSLNINNLETLIGVERVYDKETREKVSLKAKTVGMENFIPDYFKENLLKKILEEILE